MHDFTCNIIMYIFCLAFMGVICVFVTGSFGTGAGKFKVQFPSGAKGLVGREVSMYGYMRVCMNYCMIMHIHVYINDLFICLCQSLLVRK